jgi:hypothetical protein
MTIGIAAVALAAGGLGAGCGGDHGAAPAQEARATTTGRGPIPAGLRTAESAAEDTIDLALAGRREEVVEKAAALDAAAHGAVAAELRAAGVSEATIADFRSRADRVARLAREGDLLAVALASNHAFEAVAGFFALYESRVPADVTRLDHLDFEAKLRARGGDRTAVRSAAVRLGRIWAKLRPGVVGAGGEAVAHRFDGHVAKLGRLGRAGGLAGVEREAQHGLDLVDELERVYER